MGVTQSKVNQVGTSKSLFVSLPSIISIRNIGTGTYLAPVDATVYKYTVGGTQTPAGAAFYVTDAQVNSTKKAWWLTERTDTGYQFQNYATNQYLNIIQSLPVANAMNNIAIISPPTPDGTPIAKTSPASALTLCQQTTGCLAYSMAANSTGDAWLGGKWTNNNAPGWLTRVVAPAEWPLTLSMTANDNTSFAITDVNNVTSTSYTGRYVIMANDGSANSRLLCSSSDTSFYSPSQPSYSTFANKLAAAMPSMLTNNYIFTFTPLPYKSCCMADGVTMSMDACGPAWWGNTAEKCDSYMKTYCNDPLNASDPVCACLNSASASTAQVVNPKCYNAACLKNGYMVKGVRDTACPDIITCDQQITLINNGVSLNNPVTPLQDCKHVDVVTPAPNPVPDVAPIIPDPTVSNDSNLTIPSDNTQTVNGLPYTPSTPSTPTAESSTNWMLIIFFILLVVIIITAGTYFLMKKETFANNVSVFQDRI